jgi:hypothetical protein
LIGKEKTMKKITEKYFSRFYSKFMLKKGLESNKKINIQDIVIILFKN